MNFRVISNFANILVSLNSRAILIISEIFESLKTVLFKNNSHLINTISIPLCVPQVYNSNDYWFTKSNSKCNSEIKFIKLHKLTENKINFLNLLRSSK